MTRKDLHNQPVEKAIREDSIRLVEHTLPDEGEGDDTSVARQEMQGDQAVYPMRTTESNLPESNACPRMEEDNLWQADKSLQNSPELKMVGSLNADISAQDPDTSNDPPGMASSQTPKVASHSGGSHSWLEASKPVFQWLWNHRAPILLLLAIGAFPKLIFLWVFIIVAKPILEWLIDNGPLAWKLRLQNSVPASLRNSAFVSDMKEGADQGLPFILFWLYLCCAPFAIAWIALHWLRSFISAPQRKASGGDSFILTQSKRQSLVRDDTTFYYSRSFGIAIFAFFALGIPAIFSYVLYEKMGIDKAVRASIVAPIPETQKVIIPARVQPEWLGNKPSKKTNAHTKATETKEKVHRHSYYKVPDTKGEDQKTKKNLRKHGYYKVPNHAGAPPSKVTRKELKRACVATEQSTSQKQVTAAIQPLGYLPLIRGFGAEPTSRSLFLVHFYLMGLASAISVLFFRAWFSFPLNFATYEHDVEITADGIKKKLLNGWFLSVITLNRWAIAGGPDSLRWEDIKSLRCQEEGLFKLCPLPETAFKKNSLAYKILNKIAALIDGFSYPKQPGIFLIFSASETGKDFGRNIKINLNDLVPEQRARLFYSVRQWAPHVVLNQKAEEQLLGSTVLHDYRYTQLWFDVLTYRSKAKKDHVLPVGEILKGGKYKVVERLSTGGQATTYAAAGDAGEKCVLKEFILSTSSTSSASIESARDFEAEVSLLSQLTHPGVVEIEDFFFEDGRVYVVLEYIDGKTLRQAVHESGRLSEESVTEIALSICNVLEYLHGCDPPVIHRDISPENIIVRDDKSIKLIDFSLAVRQDGKPTADSCGKQCFTPPEQFREEVTSQSDIYGLGATMHFLLTGLLPKPITTSSPRASEPSVSEVMNGIVERATKLDLLQRYESIYWLKLDLIELRDKRMSLEESGIAKTMLPLNRSEDI